MDAPPHFATQQLDRLRSNWAVLSTQMAPPPQLSWDDWLEALLSFTHSQEHEFLVRGAMSAIVKLADGRKDYLVLEDLLVVAIAAHNDAWKFPDPDSDGEEDMP